MKTEKINKVLLTLIKYFLIIFAVGSPFSISVAEIGLVSALVFWLIYMIINKFKPFKFSPIDIPILIYLAGELITSIFCEYSKNAFRGYQSEWQILTVYLIISVLDKEFYKKLLKILFVISVIISIYGIYQHFTGWDIVRQKTISTTVGKFYGITGGFGLHLTFGGYYMMIALLALAYFAKLKEKRFFYISGTILVFLATIGSYARSAWIGFFFGLIFYFIISFYKSSKKLLSIFLIAIIILALLFIPKTPIRERMLAKWQLYSLYHRFKIWHSALMIIKEHPIIGIGNGNFKRYSEKYMKGTGYPAEGHPHNDYLNVYLTAGIIGLIGYLWMWVNILKVGIRYIKRNLEEKNLMAGLVSALVAFMVAGLGQCFFTDSENSMLMWFFIGGVLLLNQKSNAPNKGS